MHAGFGAASKHDLCIAIGNEAGRVADGVSTSSAGRGNGMVGSLNVFRSELERSVDTQVADPEPVFH